MRTRTLRTNKNECHGYNESENVSSQRLIVFPISFCKELQGFVDVVLAQRLTGRKRRVSSFISMYDHFPGWFKQEDMAKDGVIHNTRHKFTLQFIILYIIWINLDYVADIAFEPDAHIKLFQKMMENDCRRAWIFQLDPRSVATAGGSSRDHLEHFGSTDEGGQGGGERCREDASRDEGAESWHHAHDLEKRGSGKETHPTDSKNKQTNKKTQVFIQMLLFPLFVIWDLLYKLIASN